MTEWIETERTHLRPFELADAEEAFAWLSDPEVMRFIPGGADTTLEDTRQRIMGYVQHQRLHGFSKRLILHRETGVAIGDCGLHHLPDGERIELGFRLARSYWGQGYAIEVGRAWLDWFDTHLSGTPLFADVHADHVRSQSVLEKLGFERSHPEVVFGMPMLIYRRLQRMLIRESIGNKVSDTGGQAHLITVAAMRLMSLDGKSDWEMWQ